MAGARLVPHGVFRHVTGNQSIVPLPSPEASRISTLQPLHPPLRRDKPAMLPEEGPEAFTWHPTGELAMTCNVYSKAWDSTRGNQSFAGQTKRIFCPSFC